MHGVLLLGPAATIDATPASITALTEDVRAREPEAARALYEHAYAELRRLARSHRRRWNGNATMNTTASPHHHLSGSASINRNAARSNSPNPARGRVSRRSRPGRWRQ